MALVRTSFGTIFQTEVLLNSRRVVPYALVILFGANAWLWTAKGAAVHYGWATNSDYFILRNFIGFSFLTLPLFTALIMGDPVIRDFRAGITPLIFSKPVGRAAYIFGKFFGNFFVLVCCQMSFLLMLVVLQGLPTSDMIVLPVRLAPYIKHFFLVVVISHLVLAAVYFTVGTLTRNPKIVYLTAALFYPLYSVYQIFVLKGLPQRWRIALDPLLMNWGDKARGQGGGWLNAEAINQLAFSYDLDMIPNRSLMILTAAASLALLSIRFSTVEQSAKERRNDQILSIAPVRRNDRLYEEGYNFAHAKRVQEAAPVPVELPKVCVTGEGPRARFKQLIAASEVELRLLFAERSVVVFLPLLTMVTVLGLAYYEAVPAPTYSATYAWRTADSILLFLVAIAIFFTGEAMHRDRELMVEPVLRAVPAPDFVLLLSKFSTTLLFSIAASILAGLAAVLVQMYKGHGPVEPLTYLATCVVILIPGMAFMTAGATAINVLTRDKHLAYAVCLAITGGLFYLYNLGYNHWLYNPLLYGLWSPSDLTSGSRQLLQILTHRVYCLALTALFLSLAHLFFERKTTGGLRENGHLSYRGWAIVILSAAIAVAMLTGLTISI